MADPKHGPALYGKIPREVADELTIASIDPRLRRADAALYGTKWYDYRRIHPLAATQHFVRCYNEVYATAARMYFGGDAPIGISGNFLEKRERNTLWRLRQDADRLGMPYDSYLYAGFIWYIGECERRMLPRPNHLLHGSVADCAQTHWLGKCRDRLQLPRDPFYKAVNFSGHPYQVECEDWLIEQALSRPQPHFAVASLLYTYANVRESRMPTQFLGQESELRALVKSVSHP